MKKIYKFESREKLFEAVANRCAQQISRGIEKQGRANIIVPGGTTPAPVFEKLAAMSLDWHNVSIIPSDDRWVDATHTQSNQKLISESFLRDKASKAVLIPLKNEAVTPQAGVEQCEANLEEVIRPYDFVLLGMGNDGHFASLFPGISNLTQGLNLNNCNKAIAIDASGCPVAGEITDRISLTLSTLVDSHVIAILVTGEEKLKVIDACFEQVNANAVDAESFPMTHLLKQSKTPVEIYWAP